MDTTLKQIVKNALDVIETHAQFFDEPTIVAIQRGDSAEVDVKQMERLRRHSLLVEISISELQQSCSKKRSSDHEKLLKTLLKKLDDMISIYSCLAKQNPDSVIQCARNIIEKDLDPMLQMMDEIKSSNPSRSKTLTACGVICCEVICIHSLGRWLHHTENTDNRERKQQVSVLHDRLLEIVRQCDEFISWADLPDSPGIEQGCG